MRFDVITLFPELFVPFLGSGVTRRAYASGRVDVRLWNPRDYAEGNYRRVDDRPFGGGPGMVMLAEPLARCLAAIRADRAEACAAPLVLFSPVGQRLDHAQVEGWSAGAGAILLCGRYEGVDQRFIDAHVDAQIIKAFSLKQPSVHAGLIVSGDRFVATSAECHALRAALPDALAVEMEGAAVAQVCHEWNVPFVVIRAISDCADDTAEVDFPKFLVEVAARYCASILQRWLLDGLPSFLQSEEGQ